MKIYLYVYFYINQCVNLFILFSPREAGILVRSESGRVDGKTISINGSQQRFVVLIDSEEE